MKQYWLCILIIVFSMAAQAHNANYVAGFNLTEDGTFVYDAAADGQTKTPAQVAVDKAKSLGANHVNLNMRATMVGPYSSEITPTTAPSERSKEAFRVNRLIQYIHAQGMTAGIRPIFFVVGPSGEFPYSTRLTDG